MTLFILLLSRKTDKNRLVQLADLNVLYSSITKHNPSFDNEVVNVPFRGKSYGNLENLTTVKNSKIFRDLHLVTTTISWPAHLLSTVYC